MVPFNMFKAIFTTKGGKMLYHVTPVTILGIGMRRRFSDYQESMDEWLPGYRYEPKVTKVPKSWRKGVKRE